MAKVEFIVTDALKKKIKAKAKKEGHASMSDWIRAKLTTALKA